MPYITLRRSTIALLLASSLALALIPLALILQLYVIPILRGAMPRELEWEVLVGNVKMPWSITLYTLLASTLIACLTPTAVVEYLNRRYGDAVERELPSFFKGLAEGVRAGMPLIRALEMTARATRGPLGREMLSVVATVEMGSSLGEALERLVDRVRLASLKRAATLIMVAYESGGRVAEVLDAAAEMYGMIRSYEEEKRTSIAPYAWTVYISLLLFLLISTVILVGFITPLYSFRGVTELLAQPIAPSLFKAIFFISSFMEALLGGLVVGKMRIGSVKSGLIHAVLLSTLIVAYFNVLEVYEPLLVRFFMPQPTG